MIESGLLSIKLKKWAWEDRCAFHELSAGAHARILKHFANPSHGELEYSDQSFNLL